LKKNFQLACDNSKASAIKFIPIWKRIFESLKNKVAYDIGSQFGAYALIFKELGFDVHVFEPSKNYRKTLSENFQSFHPVAISDKNEILICELNDCTKNCELTYAAQEVKFVRLDDYSMGLPPPGFIKMDIEGMESLAFKGMQRILNTMPVIQLEYHCSLDYKGKNYPGFVPPEDGGFDFQLLYHNYLIFNSRLKKVNAIDCYGNFFLMPRNSNMIKSLI